MQAAFFRALGDLRQPGLQRVILLSLGLTLAGFIVLWVALGFLLGNISLVGWRWLDWLIDALGAIAVMVLSWLLFPAVATLITGFFLDRIAGLVEAAHYPGRGPAQVVPATVTLVATARLMGLTILLNLLVLPVYLFVPGLNLFVFIGLNGYLLGREYFEVVALRRLDPILARTARRRLAGRVFIGGAVIAGVFAVPIVNLIGPVIATAFMVHLLEGWRRSEPRLFAPVTMVRQPPDTAVT